ncbi:MAG: surface lipoprotein assembly modifier, partial [Bryobacteraceae bacterium]
MRTYSDRQHLIAAILIFATSFAVAVCAITTLRGQSSPPAQSESPSPADLGSPSPTAAPGDEPEATAEETPLPVQPPLPEITDDLEAPKEPENLQGELEIEPAPLTSEPGATVEETIPSTTGLEPAGLEPELPSSTTSPDGAQVEVNGLPQSNQSLKIVATARIKAEYDDNIFISARNEQSDLLFALSPGIALGFGEVEILVRRAAGNIYPSVNPDTSGDARSFIFVRYEPTLTLYTEHGAENTLEHDALLAGQWKGAYLTLSSRTSYKKLAGPEVEIGRRVDRTILSELLEGRYDYTDRTSFAVRVGAIDKNYDIGGFDSTEIFEDNSINYKLGARTTISGRAKFGYVEVEASPNQTYEQLLVGGQYEITDKFAVNSELGAEYRQIQGQDNLDSLNPLFSLGLTYQPFAETKIGLSASQFTQNSASTARRNVDLSSVQLGVDQRFFQRYHASFEVEYRHANFTTTTTGQQANRSDNILFLRPSLRIDLIRNTSVQLGYVYQSKDSTEFNSSF